MSNDQPPGPDKHPTMQRDSLSPDPGPAPAFLDPKPNGVDSESNHLRVLTRSPHPYHHHQFELLHPASRVVYARPHPPSPLSPSPSSTSPEQNGNCTGTALHTARRRPAPTRPSPTRAAYPSMPSRESTTTGSDSGTEADDEHFLKGLPAPRARLHKGVRGLSEPPSGASTPTFSPRLSFEGRDDPAGLGLGITDAPAEDEEERAREASTVRREVLVRRAKVAVRRTIEAALLGVLALAVASNTSVRPLLRVWGRDIGYLVALVVGLVALYPLRLMIWACRNQRPVKWLPLDLFRSNFDPAPLLYPPAITLLVSLLTAADNPAIILPNLILSISSLPHRLIPFADTNPFTINPAHWILSCLPLLWTGAQRLTAEYDIHADPGLDLNTNVLLYPLHQTAAAILRYITSTSLLPAELQLVTVGLINLLFHSRSPQMLTLSGILWVGGVCTLAASGAVIRWGISLARVPKWRFRRVPSGPKRNALAHAVMTAVSLHRIRNEFFAMVRRDRVAQEQHLGDSSEGDSRKTPFMMAKTSSIKADGDAAKNRPHNTHTPSGRKKRAMSVTMKPFFKLTAEQAARRRWMYTAWVYIAGAATYLVGRIYLMGNVFHGYDPACWALSYLLGDLRWFRLEVVKLNWDRYIPLPPRSSSYDPDFQTGWVEQLRHATLGISNTRLGIVTYFLGVMVVGFSLVFRLKDIYEVDTRRKGFHFMMVVWWLPTIFIDPALVAVLYIANLSLFLAIDLLRASQLPPLSKPIASFIAPYVDGRDLAGPVVISPIFLTIGCAIPLWLSLGSLPRVPTSRPLDTSGTSVELPGWEVPTREVAMVAGVVCVGLGDAAASLIGRRWGHHKWLWGGSKSLEGSIAFVVAVCLGLAAAKAWLNLGGWAVAGEAMGWGKSLRNTGICATVASVTEAVLTGGNDNVIVPVMLWTCVKGLGI